MKRPRRIAVFGVLSLMIGGFILIHNLDQLRVALTGPEAIAVPSQSDAPGQLGALMRDTARASRAALNDPIYRTALGVKAAFSAAMACVLIAAGSGLMRNRYWPIRLTKVWAWYAVAGAIFAITLQTAYVVPNLPAPQGAPGMGGVHYIGSGITLIFMCLFPILLLRVLPTKPVIAYLKQQPNAYPSANTAQTLTPLDQPPANQPTTTPPDQQNTWRDDPWNDNTSQ